MIVFKDVCHAYKSGVKTLDHVSFRIDDGEFVFIVGPSGAGKSTLIKLLMAEERAQSGEIVVNNFRSTSSSAAIIPKLRRTMGVVFQDFRADREPKRYLRI